MDVNAEKTSVWSWFEDRVAQWC